MAEDLSLTIAQRSAIQQLAFVPQDFEATLRHWTGPMQVGPFFLLEHLPYRDVLYRGRPVEVDASIALSYWGDIQIEIIVQHNDRVLSGYTEPSINGRDALHHILVETADVDALHASYLKRGGTTLMTGHVPGAGRFIYIDMGNGGPHIELAELSPKFFRLFDYMKTQAAAWDGRDPIRSVPDESLWG